MTSKGSIGAAKAGGATASDDQLRVERAEEEPRHSESHFAAILAIAADAIIALDG